MTIKPSKTKKKTAKTNKTKDIPSLRKRAEGILAKQKERIRDLSASNLKKLVHELGTHQIELEIQNEELRRAQKEIESSRSKYSDLYDFSPMGYFTFDKNGLIQEVNLIGAEMLSLRKQYLIDMPFQNYIDRASRVVFRNHLTEVFRTQTRLTCEINLMRKNGTLLPVELQSISIGTGEGTNDSCRTAVSDISENKRNEAELAEYRLHLEKKVDEKTHQVQAINEELQTSNEEYQTANEELVTTNEELAKRTAEVEAIIGSMSDAVVYTDTKLRILLVNQATTAVFGYSQDELIGNTTGMLYADPGELAKTEKERYNFNANKKQPMFVTRYRRKDETVFVGETRVAPVRNPKGITSGFISIHRDITERKKAEENIVRLNEDLNKRNTELTSLNKELDAFAFAISHDLRAPLRHIEGFIRMLAEDYIDKIDETGKDHIRRVQNGAERMKSLIDALLGLSRFTRSEMNLSKVYLSTLGKTAANELIKNQAERRIEFVIADDMTAIGDQSMLRVVIDNLIGNAWKFTEKQDVAKINFGVTKIDGKDVYFVKDNGAGFDMKFSDKLYIPFQRLHTESEFSGLGIGLTIVQRIIHRHGGRVWAEGEVGKGATFYFTLQ